MKVAFFLLLKSEVVWVPTRASMGRTISEMQRSGHTALPMLDDDGRYAGTIGEGDLLRELVRTPNLSFGAFERKRVRDVPQRNWLRPVTIDAEMEQLFTRAIEQNFVPVIDGQGVFVGIVRRREILAYCAGILAHVSERKVS